MLHKWKFLAPFFSSPVLLSHSNSMSYNVLCSCRHHWSPLLKINHTLGLSLPQTVFAAWVKEEAAPHKLWHQSYRTLLERFQNGGNWYSSSLECSRSVTFLDWGPFFPTELGTSEKLTYGYFSVSILCHLFSRRTLMWSISLPQQI